MKQKQSKVYLIGVNYGWFEDTQVEIGVCLDKNHAESIVEKLTNGEFYETLNLLFDLEGERSCKQIEEYCGRMMCEDKSLFEKKYPDLYETYKEYLKLDEETDDDTLPDDVYEEKMKKLEEIYTYVEERLFINEVLNAYPSWSEEDVKNQKNLQFLYDRLCSAFNNWKEDDHSPEEYDAVYFSPWFEELEVL